MRHRCLMLLAAAASALAASTARPSAQDIPQAAFDELKRGGFVVMFRHGKTNPPAGSAEDKSPLDLANCADQAMLSPQGQEEARAVGKAFASAGIPVGKVVASGYCRAIEMARLAFGHVETSDALLLPNFVPIAGAPAPPPWRQRVEIMKKMVAEVPQPAGNTILITHYPNVKAALGVEIDFGDAVIVRPVAEGGPRLIARIFASQWPSL